MTQCVGPWRERKAAAYVHSPSCLLGDKAVLSYVFIKVHAQSLESLLFIHSEEFAVAEYVNITSH